MTPLAVFHDNGKFKVSWFNPTNLRYEPVLEFNSYKDFADYTVSYVRGTAQDMEVILHNIQVFTYALKVFRPESKPDIPEVFLSAFDDRRIS